MRVIERIDGFRTVIGGPPPDPAFLAPGEEPMPLHEVLLDLQIVLESDGRYLLCIDARDGTYCNGSWHKTLAAAHERIEEVLGIPASAWRKVDEPEEPDDEPAPRARPTRRRAPPRNRGRRRA